LSLPRSARRVQEALHALGVDVDVRELEDSTRTAPEAAAAVGCELGAIVKSLVFRGASSGRPLLALVSGANRADEGALEEAFGEPVERPDADWVREVTGFAIGGIPPVGHATAMPVLVDEDLLAYPEVWCAAGTPRSIFGLAPRQMVDLTGGRVIPLRLRTGTPEPAPGPGRPTA
jgi:prolyl-tRNA editing enzyme YbaK/EbsC (Cys-tRNA(Pro) deacylase)